MKINKETKRQKRKRKRGAKKEKKKKTRGKFGHWLPKISSKLFYTYFIPELCKYFKYSGLFESLTCTSMFIKREGEGRVQ